MGHITRLHIYQRLQHRTGGYADVRLAASFVSPHGNDSEAEQSDSCKMILLDSFDQSRGAVSPVLAGEDNTTSFMYYLNWLLAPAGATIRQVRYQATGTTQPPPYKDHCIAFVVSYGTYAFIDFKYCARALTHRCF